MSASTQTQALSAILFLYKRVVMREFSDLGDVVRARRPKHLPVVMTRDEAKSLLSHLEGQVWLMASLMYGAGMRLMECLRLRVQDVDFRANQIVVRSGKGFKDRITMLPQAPRELLMEHLKTVKRIHQEDLAQGLGRVKLPYHVSNCVDNPLILG